MHRERGAGEAREQGCVLVDTPCNRAALIERSQIDHRATEKTILVPLTNSLYVPGKLRDLEHVIVDVGTGYYVKKVRPTTHVRPGTRPPAPRMQSVPALSVR